MIVVVAAALHGGCSAQSKRVSTDAVWDLRAGRYTAAREQLRPHAADVRSADVILDNLRLAVAALHDGAFFEAEHALMRAYPFLVAGTVNPQERQTAATFGYEGRLVWKGEPFEQAMAWYYQSLVQMIKGDWENARAASRNMLFTLVDFAGATHVDEAMRRAESPEWFNRNAARVESDLTIGYLIAGIAERWQGHAADAEEMFGRARELRSELEALIDRLEHGSYNTLLFVEAEQGPRKRPVGDYGEGVVFEPRVWATPEALRVWITEDGLASRASGHLSHGLEAHVPGSSDVSHGLEAHAPGSSDVSHELEAHAPMRLDAVDTWALAQHPRWWSMRSLRETKRVVGNVLTLAGTGAVIYGTTSRDANTRDKALVAGLAAIVVGEMLAHSSAADLRHFDALPRTVYIVPLDLPPGPNRLELALPSRGLRAVRSYILPGYETPAVYTVRLEGSGAGGRGSGVGEVVHPNDVTGPIVGTFPYILGGTCVCTPGEEALTAYQAGGYLLDYTVEDLRDLYRAEGILFRPLPLSRETAPTWRHILQGGRWLYTPIPGSAGFERLTFQQARPYQPVSREVQEARQRIGQQAVGNWP